MNTLNRSIPISQASYLGSRRFDAIKEILAEAGILVNGTMPWDLQIKDCRFFDRLIKGGSVALGESYMDGWWDCARLDEFFCRILPLEPQQRVKDNWKLLLMSLDSAILNSGRKSKAFEIGERHYDTGNDLFTRMLDKRMVYSCGYWKDANTLDEAQEAKLDLTCRKLGLRPGDRVLDIGCGWGSFAKYAAEKHGATVIGITVSRQQIELGQELCKGLPVELRLQDYRDINEKFDHIVSIGMFEHVGFRNHRQYMEVARRCLKDGGLFLLHTIGSRRSEHTGDPWTAKYIFPNSLVPSMKQIVSASEDIFIIEDVQNLGIHYDATLMSWFNNFKNTWNEIRDKYGDRFYRMWKYYLLSSAGSFRARYVHVWQIVFSPNGIPGGYSAIR